MSGPLVTIGDYITFNGHGEVFVHRPALDLPLDTLRSELERAFFFSREPALQASACGDDSPLSEYWKITLDFMLGVLRAPRAVAARQTQPSKTPIPVELRWKVWERDDFSCCHCGARAFLSCDHVYPESLGGQTVLDNLQTLCRSCNSRKGTRVNDPSS